MRRLWGVIITLGFCGSSPLLFDPASAAVSQESSAFEVDTYFLRERVTPSATLRVVDETGRATEIPVDFSQARVEPRGFWGDVAVNGLALFSASLCIVLLKEALAWSAARRRKARAKAQSDIETRRRTAISAQLEAADLEIRNLRTSSKEGKGEGLDDEVRRLMDLLDASTTSWCKQRTSCVRTTGALTPICIWKARQAKELQTLQGPICREQQVEKHRMLHLNIENRAARHGSRASRGHGQPWHATRRGSAGGAGAHVKAEKNSIARAVDRQGERGEVTVELSKGSGAVYI